VIYKTDVLYCSHLTTTNCCCLGTFICTYLEKHIYDIINGLLWGQIAAYILFVYKNAMLCVYAFGKICFHVSLFGIPIYTYHSPFSVFVPIVCALYVLSVERVYENQRESTVARDSPQPKSMISILFRTNLFP
jgi:hypothetical protein